MASATPFHLVRSSVYQLKDLSEFLSLPSTSSSASLVPLRLSRLQRMSNVERPPRSYSSASWSVSERIARLDDFGSSASRPPRHCSLVSMRTYYAFGARSASLAGSSRSAISAFSSKKPAMYTSPPTRSSICPPLSYLPRSSTSNLYNFDRSSSYSSYPTSLRTTYSASQVHFPNPRSTSSYSSSRFTSDFKTDQSAFPPLSPSNRSALARPREVDTTEPGPSASRQLPSQEHRDEIDNIQNELEELKRRNKLLEDDLARMKLLVKDKERSEVELKRRLLESEAETKVWRNKCGMIQSTAPEQTETPSIDSSILDQLDSAADKLARLNAVKDLKLLQSEMETALQEIREK